LVPDRRYHRCQPEFSIRTRIERFTGCLKCRRGKRVRRNLTFWDAHPFKPKKVCAADRPDVIPNGTRPRKRAAGGGFASGLPSTLPAQHFQGPRPSLQALVLSGGSDRLGLQPQVVFSSQGTSVHSPNLVGSPLKSREVQRILTICLCDLRRAAHDQSKRVARWPTHISGGHILQSIISSTGAAQDSCGETPMPTAEPVG
jgi:hypothetical protein